jgi:hypothetical protein
MSELVIFAALAVRTITAAETGGLGEVRETGAVGDPGKVMVG